jgi:hypothetical protein
MCQASKWLFEAPIFGYHFVFAATFCGLERVIIIEGVAQHYCALDPEIADV